MFESRGIRLTRLSFCQPSTTFNRWKIGGKSANGCHVNVYWVKIAWRLT